MLGRMFVGGFVLLTAAAAPPAASAVGTAFTYQGQLQQDGGGASGPCDFSLSLWDAAGSGSPPAGGSQVGATQTATGAAVSDGLFTLRLDFGAAAFSAGADRWLQIAVRCPAGGGAYQTLGPRQPLTAAPFALFATAIADGAVGATKLAAGAVGTAQLAANAVTAAQIADGSIASSDLGNGAVSTAKIGDGQVTGAKIADGQIGGAKVAVPLRLTSTVANTTIGALDGTSTAQSGVGVSGRAGSGVDAAGVYGTATTGAGVFGESSSGDGVRALSHNGVGVFGEGTGDVGVWGTSDIDGVFGVSTGAGDGVFGVAGDGAGVHGESTNGTGVLGEGIDYGVHGIANGENARGVFGESDEGVGVAGQSQTTVGVAGIGPNGVLGITAFPDGNGVSGSSLAPNDAEGVGVRGEAKQGIGVRGKSDSGFAGFFEGPVQVTATLSAAVLSAGVKLFRIDHPLDPANRYLQHAAVESPEMKTVYDGVVVLDADGEARVELPAWFESLNRDFRYQLTCIGGAAPVYVAEEVREAHFRIAGGTPGLKVSWQVTGVRADAFARAHPLAVEVEKDAAERGRYLHPVELGQPASLTVDRISQAAAR